MSKFIIVTGGVVSSIGKGISGASIGKLLQLNGLKVNMIKCDPYMNIDPGAMSPFQHGEVFITEDGAEADLDLGHYERFLDVPMTKKNTNTAGQIYLNVLDKERKGEYGGVTVQIIPHITNEIKSRMTAFEKDFDITIIEIGGTVGDIESLAFIEAARQLRLERGHGNVLNVHVTLIPYIKMADELKTKPTQHSVNKMRELGLEPDMLICRSEYALNEELKKKISLFCSVSEANVIEALDCKSIYEIPLKFYEQKVDVQLLKLLDLKPKQKPPQDFFDFTKNALHPSGSKAVKIGVVGKYSGHQDAYKSINEALLHAGIANKVKLDITYINSERDDVMAKLKEVDAILVPGGSWGKGVEAKLEAIKYARESKKPFLGICLGMHCAVVEAARNLLGIKDAASSEFDPGSKNAVVCELPLKENVVYRKGNKRIGSYTAKLEKGSLAEKVYAKSEIFERHHNGCEMNPEYVAKLAEKGLKVSAWHEGVLPEIVEIADHPYFVAVGFHPEFGSRPTRPHPLFDGLIKTALNHKK